MKLKDWWLRWAHMKVRAELIWFAVIAILLALYAWLLFTGTVTRRH